MVHSFIQKNMNEDKNLISAIANILSSDEYNEELFLQADKVKRENFANNIYIRGIIEFSNYCRQSCSYCGINVKMRDIKRYRMQPQDLIDCAVKTAQVYKTVILQSGEDTFYTAEMMANIIGEIKNNVDCALTLSIGERTFDEYSIMKKAGADRFLIKHETADAVLYEKLHGKSLEERLSCHKMLRELGFELGSGFMIGLPSQTDEILAKDLLLLKEMEVEMAGIGPFISHSKTPLVGEKNGDPNKTLKVLALARLLLPKCNLPSTTALNVMGGMKNALFCGANVIMQKATPFEYRALYDIYPGRDAKEIPIEEQRAELDRSLSEMGLHSV